MSFGPGFVRAALGPWNTTGPNGGLAGLHSASAAALRAVPCFSSPGPSAREAADVSASVDSYEPREALLGGFVSSAAAFLSTLLAELPSSWGKACGSWLGNLG